MRESQMKFFVFYVLCFIYFEFHDRSYWNQDDRDENNRKILLRFKKEKFMNDPKN